MRIVRSPYLYLDADTFFACCELADRGLGPSTPLVVSAADAPPVRPGHSIIAETRAARAAGVRRGERVGVARARCPGLIAVAQRPDLYVRVHHRMVAAVETVLPVLRACSVDEVLARLGPGDDPPSLMAGVGRALRDALGPVVTASLGVADTPLLAKMAAESAKPGGRTWWPRASLPEALLVLAVDDVPGIGPARAQRLARAGIATMAALWAATPRHVGRVLGTVEGERIAWSLHGMEAESPRGPRRSISCGRVLVPGEADHVRTIVRALVLTLMERARAEGLHPLALSVSGAGRLPVTGTAYGPVLRALSRRWRGVDARQVGAVLQVAGAAPSGWLPGIEPVEGRDGSLADLVDRVRRRFGPGSLDYGGVRRTPWMGRKIAFDRIPA